MSLKEKAIAFARANVTVPYKYENGPLAEVDWFVEGLNCQLLIHLAYQEFYEVILPRELRSSELYADTDWLVEKSLETVSEGDLVFFGPSNLNPIKDPNNADAKKLHLAMVSNVNGSVDLIHARPSSGIVIDTLEQVMSYRRGKKRAKPYEKVFAVKGLNF